jgi:hypothetical protein
MHSERHGEYALTIQTFQIWIDENPNHADKVLATIEANMVAIAKKVGMREKTIRELPEVNAVRRLLAKENAADVLLRLNPISRDAIYKAVEVEYAKLLRSHASVV